MRVSRQNGALRGTGLLYYWEFHWLLVQQMNGVGVLLRYIHQCLKYRGLLCLQKYTAKHVPLSSTF